MWDPRPTSETLTVVLPLILVTLAAGLLPPRHEPDSPFFASQRWRYRHVILVLGVIIVGQFVSPARVWHATGMWRWAIDTGTIELFIVVSVWSVARSKHHRPWRALGFDLTTALDDALWSLRIGLGIVSLLALLVLATRNNAPAVLPPAVSHDQIGGFMVVVTLLNAAVLGPIAEELFFRALALGPLLRRFRGRGAVTVSAVIWATGHYSGFSLKSALGVFAPLVFGIVYAEIYRRRGSMVPAVTFHMVGNTAALLLRDPYLATFGRPFLGVSVCLWIIVAVLLFLRKRNSVGTDVASPR